LYLEVPLDCSRTKKSSVAVSTAFVLAWQEIILAFIRLSLSWSTDVPGNREVVPMDGASDPRARVALAFPLGLNRIRVMEPDAALMILYLTSSWKCSLCWNGVQHM